MERHDWENLFQQVASGELSPEEAVRRAACEPFDNLGFARPDLHRGLRQGVGEVVYGEGKTAGQIAGVCRSLVAGGQPHVLVTRLSAEKACDLREALGEGGLAASGMRGAVAAGAGAHDAAASGEFAADLGIAEVLSAAAPDVAALSTELPDTPSFEYRDDCRLGIVGGMPACDGSGPVVVAAAGTSDLPVAEEAAVTAEFLGSYVVRLYDVGVAGMHRLLACADQLASAQVVVAVAGMEGALPSVVAGLVPCPVIAVPTSVGYGASFGGIAALLAMLNSCASGVSVVNIDNGFGAAYQASLIAHLARRRG